MGRMKERKSNIKALEEYCSLNNLDYISVSLDELKRWLKIPGSYQIIHITERILSHFTFRPQKIKSGSNHAVEFICIPFNEKAEQEINLINTDINVYYNYYYMPRIEREFHFNGLIFFEGFKFPKTLKKGRRICPFCGSTLILRILKTGIAFVGCGSLNRRIATGETFCDYKFKIKDERSLAGINIMQFQGEEPIYSRTGVLNFYRFNQRILEIQIKFEFDEKKFFRRYRKFYEPIVKFSEVNNRYLSSESNSFKERTQY